MNVLSLPKGNSDFRRIRELGCYYVDKTGIIPKMMKQNAASTFLFTRPRRFGKTLMQQMLSAFFDIRMDSRALFEGLDVMSDRNVVDRWMNSAPVIYLTFKDVEGPDYESALGMLKRLLTGLVFSYRFILDGDIAHADRSLMQRILDGDATNDDVSHSLYVLARLLREYYGADVIILIDEYDVPLAKAYRYGYYDRMLMTIRLMLSSVLKDNDCVAKAVLTGCLRISKESLFTGLNNLDVYSLAGDGYGEYFGFTAQEVRKMLVASGLESRMETFRTWYDGYRIAGHDIFCPWDVLSYLDDLYSNEDAVARNYWANTSGNEEILAFLERSSLDISSTYDELVAGHVVDLPVTDELIYRDLYSSDENIWSMLFACGYLTLAGPFDENGTTAMRIPNEEIRILFEKTLLSWFRDSYAKRPSLTDGIYDALWACDGPALSRLLSESMMETMSFHDYGEDTYHALLLGLFMANRQYSVKSNRESGHGRPDIIVQDRRSGDVAILELKCTSRKEDVDGCVEKALCQIDDNLYAQEAGDAPKVLAFGICFYKKTATARGRVVR